MGQTAMQIDFLPIQIAKILKQRSINSSKSLKDKCFVRLLRRGLNWCYKMVVNSWG